MKRINRGSCRTALRLVALGLFFLPHAATPFAGEDFLEGNPWHHEAISEDALRSRGFGQDAVQEIAWNADYVDSYLYNPLWWIQGGLSRFKASIATAPELEKVHFDDHFSGDHVRRTWRRYLTGCMAGLVWAAEQNDVAAGRNILGVTLHALQDFYSHSNWIDSPDRRDLTWFAFQLAERSRLAIYTGAYEHPEQVGVKPHGKIVPSCSILSQSLLKPILEPGCSAYSPFHNSHTCTMYETCKSAVPIQPDLFGFNVPGNVLYASPPGMNLDARWSAGIGVRVRGIRDLNGDAAFDRARALAQEASEQWLQIVEEKLAKMGYGSFFARLKTAATTGEQEDQYENFGQLPYQFLSAGPYPPDLRTPEEEWYLRVRIKTADVLNAGTDADIYLEAEGKRFLLDYSPRGNPIIGHNDFERGDDEVYTVGPFEKVPAQFRLFNDEAGGPEVSRAIAQSAAGSVKALADAAGSALLSLVAGHADEIGSHRMFWTAEQLSAIPATGRAFTISINGGDEGRYRVDGRILKLRESPPGTTQPWHEFRVQLTSLYCIQEGRVDRLTTADEPYLMALLVPFPGNVMKYKTDPFKDTDTGETKRIGFTFPTVRLPKAHGMLSLPVSLWESDSESAQSRAQQLDRFANEANRRTGPARQSVLDAVGAAVAADWRIESIGVYAFNRGGHSLKTGQVYESRVDAWLKGKERRTVALDSKMIRNFPVVDARTIDVLESPAKSPLGYGYDFTGKWNVQFSAGGAFRMQPGIRATIRLVSSGNTIEGFYEGQPVETEYLRLRPGKVFDGKVVEVLFNGHHLYNFTGTWSLESMPKLRNEFEVEDVFQFRTETSLSNPYMKNLFLGLEPVLHVEIKRKSSGEIVRSFARGRLLSRIEEGGSEVPVADRGRIDLNGKWGYGNSNGGDYYRVETDGKRFLVVLERADRNHSEYQVGDRVFDGTIEIDPDHPNQWRVKGSALRRPQSGTAPPKTFDSTGTVRLQRRREDGRLLAIFSFEYRYESVPTPDERVIFRVLPPQSSLPTQRKEPDAVVGL